MIRIRSHASKTHINTFLPLNHQDTHKRLIHSILIYSDPFLSTKAAEKWDYGLLSLSHSLTSTHTHSAAIFSILAIKDAHGQIEVNVEEFSNF